MTRSARSGVMLRTCHPQPRAGGGLGRARCRTGSAAREIRPASRLLLPPFSPSLPGCGTDRRAPRRGHLPSLARPGCHADSIIGRDESGPAARPAQVGEGADDPGLLLVELLKANPGAEPGKVFEVGGRVGHSPRRYHCRARRGTGGGKVVSPDGIEPSTNRLRVCCSTN